MIKLDIEDILKEIQKDPGWNGYISDLIGKNAWKGTISDKDLYSSSGCYGKPNSNPVAKGGKGGNERKNKTGWKWKDKKSAKDGKGENFKQIESLFIKVFIKEYPFCPYCGKIPLIAYTNDNNKQCRTFDLDHFYPKDSYEHLTFNFWNLIPICKICNQLKSTTDFSGHREYYHPYFGWITNGVIDPNKNQHTKFVFTEEATNPLIYRDPQKLYKWHLIYPNAQDTRNDIKFIRHKMGNTKAYGNKRFANFDTEIKKYYLKNFAPENENDLLSCANGKMKFDMVKFLYDQDC